MLSHPAVAKCATIPGPGEFGEYEIKVVVLLKEQTAYLDTQLHILYTHFNKKRVPFNNALGTQQVLVA